jgi:hypothetical protein
MESMKPWRRAEMDKNGRILEIEDEFLPKLTARMASTINGRVATMSGRKFNTMFRTFLDTVNAHCAE